MELEVLVATMRREDLSLAEKMNVRQNVLIANQCEKWDYISRQTEYGTVRMVSSNTRGVGINRNLALNFAEGDILLFADDDLTYYDGTLQGVLDAFYELPDADVIFFGLDMTKNGKVYEKRRNKKKRVYLWNSLKYGAARTAVRRSAVESGRLSFSTLFGGGCIYGSGEDTLFVRDCFRNGLKAYSHPYVLGSCATDSSSWFAGYNEKFMFDKGAWIANAFPLTKHLIKWHFIRRYLPKTELTWWEELKYMNMGIKAYNKKADFYEAMANSNDN